MRRSNEPMHRTQLYLPVRQIDDMKKVEAVTGAARSEIVRRAIDAFLEMLVKEGTVRGKRR
jgi:hypothetical protein